jgi:sortase A
VRSYVGRTDDARGHAIQNTGIVASPTGPEGGTGPGGVGNYQVTGHRTSSTRIFEFLPDLERGDRVLVTAGRTTYVYRVRRTRITSFREPASLRAQRAEVPGRPGVSATRAMITLSTCRTPEDHAEGNYWSDEFDNPENRIDKIGVLVRTRPA